jgi:putative Mg2+ transporter-C (MgtC) family protein
MFLTPDDLLKLVLSIVIGGSLGLEREIHNKSAGFRTISLITIGATLFTIISSKLGDSRVIANIVAGVGFLGAGVIMRDEGRVKGLTTASTIWVAAALGMAIGIDQYLLAVVFAAAALVVLWLFARLDKRIETLASEPRTYEIVFADHEGKFEQLDNLLRQNKLDVIRHRRYKRADALVGEWDTHGSLANHAEVTKQLLADMDVREVRY